MYLIRGILYTIANKGNFHEWEYWIIGCPCYHPFGSHLNYRWLSYLILYSLSFLYSGMSEYDVWLRNSFDDPNEKLFVWTKVEWLCYCELSFCSLFCFADFEVVFCFWVFWMIDICVLELCNGFDVMAASVFLASWYVLVWLFY